MKHGTYMKGVATGVVLTILAGGGIRAVQFYRSGEILSDVSFTQKVKYLENMIDEEYLGDISTDDLKEGVYAGLIYGLDVHIKPVALIRRYSSCRCMWLNDISHVCQIRHLVPDCC